ncbi:hypothetical protein F5X99DRAFT_409945 [Biscogniauxia marginata]|nr:hypothetical protein F5X99DRAFT_409945 [Biscogniauxia marginata]
MTAPKLPKLLPWCQAAAAAAATSRKSHSAPRLLRSYGTNASPQGALDIDAIRADMLSRPVQLTWDVLRPTNSYLLNVALADFLPPSCQPPHFRLGCGSSPSVARDDGAVADWFAGRGPPGSYTLPPAHHLVYFPLQLPTSGLCPDGTDPLHSPGGPWTRRMWAGGSIAHMDAGALALDAGPAVCVERVEHVSARGNPGSEKIFVEVLREYLGEAAFARRWDSHERRLRSVSEDEVPGGEHHGHALTERRTLVFLRERTTETEGQQGGRNSRVVRAPYAPDFAITVTPTPTLLFHYSALTFNAHAIHLDRGYCRDAEGHRDLLVHGPLTLTLMLSALGSQLRADEGERLAAVDYRHLAPLYVGEPMRVCVRRKWKKFSDDGGGGDGEAARSGWWDVWVEDKDGQLSVRGTTTTKI